MPKCCPPQKHSSKHSSKHREDKHKKHHDKKKHHSKHNEDRHSKHKNYKVVCEVKTDSRADKHHSKPHNKHISRVKSIDYSYSSSRSDSSRDNGYNSGTYSGSSNSYSGSSNSFSNSSSSTRAKLYKGKLYQAIDQPYYRYYEPIICGDDCGGCDSCRDNCRDNYHDPCNDWCNTCRRPGCGGCEPCNDWCNTCRRPGCGGCDPCNDWCNTCRRPGCGGCDPCNNGCYNGCFDNCSRVNPCITYQVNSVATTQQNTQYVHAFNITFTRSGYFRFGCTTVVVIRAQSSGDVGNYYLFRTGNSETVNYTVVTTSVNSPILTVCAVDENGCSTTVEGNQTPPVEDLQLTASLLLLGQAGNDVTIGANMSNTGSTELVGVTFDLPQPVNTSNYVAGTNFTIVNTPGGTVMRFGPINIPGNSTITGSFQTTQDTAGSYDWSSDVFVNGIDSGIDVNLTTTQV